MISLFSAKIKLFCWYLNLYVCPYKQNQKQCKTIKVVKPYRKFYSIKALEQKWRHQDEHAFEAPTFNNVFTKFEPDMTSSFRNQSFLKIIAKFIRQLSTLNENDVLKIDNYVNPPSHNYVYQV